MNTPKYEQNILLKFPPEIWASIAVYLSGEQLGRLKLTGSNILWNKLRCTNVVTSINLGTDYLEFKSWPAYLSEFPSLYKLCLCSNDSLNWSKWSPRLDSMPTTLRKLKICGYIDNFGIFCISKQGERLKFETLVPHLEVLDLRYSKITAIESTSLPSSLTKLGLERWYGDFDLPKNLLHFETRAEIVLRSAIRPLPPKLESIKSFHISGFRFLFPLPPTLRKLRIDRWETLDDSLLSQLPISLETLGKVTLTSELASPEIISMLPPSLVDLSIDATAPSECWSHFPRTLKKLRFITEKPESNSAPLYGDSSVNEKHFPLHLLPRSITQLDLLTSNFFPAAIDLALPSLTSPMPSQFPPYLTALYAPELYLTANATKHLPACLTRLTIYWLCERVCEHLPRGLSELCATNTLMSPGVINFLPPRLFSLEMGHAPAFAKYIDYSNPEGTRVSVSSLPSFSTHENYGTNISWLGDQALPSTLSQINLRFFKNIGDSFAGQNLPNLVELNVGAALDFTDLAIPLLSRHITSLNLYNSSKITGKCFPYLPKGLDKLILGTSTCIYDSDIQHLPRTLHSIFLDSAVHLTNGCVQSFPRQAVYIHIKKNELITTDSFPDLPYPIRKPAYGTTADFVSKKWQTIGGSIMGPS